MAFEFYVPKRPEDNLGIVFGTSKNKGRVSFSAEFASKLKRVKFVRFGYDAEIKQLCLDISATEGNKIQWKHGRPSFARCGGFLREHNLDLAGQTFRPRWDGKLFIVELEPEAEKVEPFGNDEISETVWSIIGDLAHASIKQREGKTTINVPVGMCRVAETIYMQRAARLADKEAYVICA